MSNAGRLRRGLARIFAAAVLVSCTCGKDTDAGARSDEPGLGQEGARVAGVGIAHPKISQRVGSDIRRTVIFIKGEALPGQDLFVRGGIDHRQSLIQRGVRCEAPDGTPNHLCAIPIVHRNQQNATTAAWKRGDNLLDWYGREPGQTGTGGAGGLLAEGTPADWTTSHWPRAWGEARRVEVDGFGFTPLNSRGPHYWMVDVDMDCGAAFQATDGTPWFEVKSFLSNGPGWESDVQQTERPYVSGNHFAICGMVNVFQGGASSAQFLRLPGGAGTPRCSLAPPSGEASFSLRSGGVTRRAARFVPPGYVSTTPVPLVLAFHSSGGGMDSVLPVSNDPIARSGLVDSASAHGFVLVAPQALLHGGDYWNVPGIPLPDGSAVPVEAPSDIELVQDLIGRVMEDLCIDPDRIYAVGFSGGGRFASALGCELGERLAAIAPFSGLRAPAPCPTKRALPVVSFHGTLDRTNPYAGGGPAYWGYGVEEAAARWASHNGCTLGPATTPLGNGLAERAWGHCRDEGSIRLFVRDGGDHRWPEAQWAGANELVWSALEDHRLGVWGP